MAPTPWGTRSLVSSLLHVPRPLTYVQTLTVGGAGAWRHRAGGQRAGLGEASLQTAVPASSHDEK